MSISKDILFHISNFPLKNVALTYIWNYCRVETDIFANFGFLYGTFVWAFPRWIFPSDHLLIFFSHSCPVLVCFLLLAFQSFFSIPTSSLSVYTGIAWWIYYSNTSSVVVKQASRWLILLELSSFCCSHFFPKYSKIFVISSRTLWIFVSFLSKIGTFSNIRAGKSKLSSMFYTPKTRFKVIST